jgi:hypothetical protein
MANFQVSSKGMDYGEKILLYYYIVEISNIHRLKQNIHKFSFIVFWLLLIGKLKSLWEIHKS